MEIKEAVDGPSPGKADVELGTISFNGIHAKNLEMASTQGTSTDIASSAVGPLPLVYDAARARVVTEVSSVPAYPITVSSFNGIHQRSPETCVSQMTSSSIISPVVCSVPPVSDAAKAIAVPSMAVMSSVPAYPGPAAMYYALIAARSGEVGTAHETLVGVPTSFGGETEVTKKRRQPRKYDPHGSMALSVAPFSTIPNPISPSQKRGRGRPPGSGKNQQLAALGGLLYSSAGVGFMPHAITVVAGEDVAARIISLSQQGPRGICVLLANGAISSAMLQQPAIFNGRVTFEGRFEILSLSGSFLMTEARDPQVRSGGLSVSLAGPDGRVIGGRVSGMLIAASPVQVVLGSFMYNPKKQPQASKYSANQEADPGSSGMLPGVMPMPSENNETMEVKLERLEVPLANQGTCDNMNNSTPEESSEGQVTVIPSFFDQQLV